MRSEIKEKLPYLALLAGVATIYFAAGQVGFLVATNFPIRSPLWPPTGIALAMVLLLGFRIWPGILLGAFVFAWVSWPLSRGHHLAAVIGSLGVAAGNTLESLAGAWLVNRFAKGRDALRQPNTLLLFVSLAAVITPVIGATVGMLARVLAGVAPWQHADDLWFVGWLSSMASVVLLTPLILAWRYHALPQWSAKRASEAIALLLLLLVLSGFAFGDWLATTIRGGPLAFVIIPILLWTALRFGQRGTATAALLVTCLATLGTLHGHGAFALPDHNSALLLMQNFLVVITVMSLVLSADVTQRQQIHDGLRASESELRRRVEELQAVFDAAPVGIAVAHDPECRSITGNPACAGMIHSNGVTTEPAPKIVRAGKEVPPAELPMQSAARRGVTVPGQEFEVIFPDGRVQNSFVSASPLYDDAGQVRGSLGIFVDLTAKKQAEREILRLNAELEHRVGERTAQLEAINKELEAFSYSVSHDLRAPLRSIRGFSEVLLQRYAAKLDTRAQDFLRRIGGASQHMDELIEDLLKLSRVSRTELVRRTVDLSALAESIATGLCQAEPKRAVKFILQPGLQAQGDERLLRIVLENLLRNAWKFTLQQPKPRIEFGSVSGPEPAFFVSDNGAGFDMAYADRLFGVFQRLHPATEFPGTGVGLATVQRIIHRHGGKIWAQGAVNQGATFYFSLAMSEAVLDDPASCPNEALERILAQE